MAQFDVAVVGGGLVGTATAYELGARGARTLLLDRADPGRATDAGAGILSPETTKRDDPGWVEYLCERIPLARPGQVEDLDGALLLLASDAGRYITGQTLLVDGGISVGAVRALPRE